MVKTDHNSLKWLLSFRNPEGQVARWIEQLSEFDFEVLHRSGKNHTNADALSRISLNNLCLATKLDGLKSELIEKEQKNDPVINKIIDCVLKNNFTKLDTSKNNKKLKIFWIIRDNLKIHNDMLYKIYNDGINKYLRLIIPKSLKPLILKLAHNNVTAGHFNHNKVFEYIKKNSIGLVKNVILKTGVNHALNVQLEIEQIKNKYQNCKQKF